MRILLFAILTALLITAAPSQAQSPHQAGLVVQFPDGHIETACVEFSEEEINGVDLLTRSGLAAIFDHSSGLGTKVCKIGETGCNYPGEDCWCRCQGSPCAYWNYWALKDRQWLYSPLGASARRLGNGDVDGWAWGDGGQPPSLSFVEICGATAQTFSSPLVTPTIRPTLGPQPSPTATTTGPASPLAQPTSPSTPTPTPATKIFIPATSGKSPTPADPAIDLPPSPDRYVGFAGVLAALGLIALSAWRRGKGV
ncbi:MAG: hypothetical protein B6I34_01320 [Anaerolineaceae bacterium 4572_32.1]|nr:MAG: hypothetical protein B6I34_01320 [Anaerolineaceae bacterium 4572_32.1]